MSTSFKGKFLGKKRLCRCIHQRVKTWMDVVIVLREGEDHLSIHKDEEDGEVNRTNILLHFKFVHATYKKGGHGRALTQLSRYDEGRLMTLVTGDQIEYVLMLKDEQQRDNVYNQIQTFIKKFKDPSLPARTTLSRHSSARTLSLAASSLEEEEDIMESRENIRDWMEQISRSANQKDDDMTEFDYNQMYAKLNPLTDNQDKNRSVVGDVVTQLLQTMNPTKVRLPCCVLECRSLLESFADSFAAAQYFAEISKGSDPSERFLAVLKFYLTMPKCNRYTHVPSKPYNPVKGELFVCEWPVPGNGNLRFIAEQVSHHPPISAVYADHLESRCTYTASIYTKSGLNVSWKPPFLQGLTVTNLGESRIRLLDHHEEYVMVLPSAAVDSVLSSPQLIIEGQTKIECPKTKMSAEINFIEDCQVEGRTTGLKDDVTISGHWDGLLQIKTQLGEPETLVDLSRWPQPEIQKIVAPVENQRWNESRRLWRSVTRGLAGYPSAISGDEAKYEVEENARAREAAMTQQNRTWKPKFFEGDPMQKVDFKYEIE